MYKKVINYMLLMLLLADLTYSFMQHISMPLDGDMAGGIVPAQDVKPILNDPFGISVLTKNAVYPNPNRFFAHWTYFNYFNQVPICLQNFVSPVQSVYLSSAIAKIVIQFMFIVVLAIYITGRSHIFNSDFLLASILIVPLLQTNGYRSYMGIIDPSITYTFFYALPCLALLWYYLPFYFDTLYGSAKLKSLFAKFLVFVLCIFVVFNGALNPGIILTISLLIGINCFLKTDQKISLSHRFLKSFKMLPKSHLIFYVIISLLSLYSLYIGKNNAIFIGETVSIGERYARVPLGLIIMISQKLGYPILLLLIGFNIFLLKRNPQFDDGKKSLRVFGWMVLFSLLYMMLLPLGGYKDYRPNILRYDTMMPVTIGLIFMYSKSSFIIIKNLSGNFKFLYVLIIALFSVVFTNADKPEFDKNSCEKSALLKISISKNKTVFIESNCTILSWSKITNPANSELNGQLLKKWKITLDDKRYYQNE